MFNESAIAAILFVAGDEGASRQELADALDLSSEELVVALQQLQLDYQDNSSIPLELREFNDRYVLVTKPEYQSAVEVFAQSRLQRPLSRAAIETLAIIAYRQPITRVGIDEIRGVDSSNMVQRLLARQLIKEVGRLDAPGRPYLYGVSDYFLDYFGLKNLEELPEIEPIAIQAERISGSLFQSGVQTVDLSSESTE